MKKGGYMHELFQKKFEWIEQAIDYNKIRKKPPPHPPESNACLTFEHVRFPSLAASSKTRSSKPPFSSN
jgi:hypothetical protein